MIRNLIVALGATSTLILSLCATADMIPTKKVPLSKTEYSDMENIACLAPHKIKAEYISGYQFENQDLKKAYVKCKSIDAYGYYEANCSFVEKRWSCGETQLVTVKNLYNQEMKIYTQGISPDSAYEILAKISTYGAYQGVPMDEAIGSPCHVSQAIDNETIELDCSYKITVSTWCPQPELTNCPRVVFLTPRALP